MPKASRQSEENHLALVFRQLVQQTRRLLSRQRPFTACEFSKEPNLRRLVDPFPFVSGPNQDGAHKRQITVGRGLRGFLQLGYADIIENGLQDSLRRGVRPSCSAFCWRRPDTSSASGSILPRNLSIRRRGTGILVGMAESWRGSLVVASTIACV